MSHDPVLSTRNGPSLGVINNNPDMRNALSVDYLDGLRAGLQTAADDPGISAVILSGAGGFFCAGGNLNVLKTRREMDETARVSAINLLHDAIRAIRACPKPVIAAVEGGAAGAGASIALACDLVVAAKGAYFAVSYVRVGLSPDGGATAFLSEFAPRQLVNEILMFGDKIPVERLYALGAVNRLCAKDDAVSIAEELAVRLYHLGPAAVATAKKLALLARENTLDEQLEVEALTMAKAQASDEAAEGIAAFLEKRRPDFTKFRS